MKDELETITELLYMREALRDRLVDLVLAPTTAIIIALTTFFKTNTKNKALNKINNIVMATILYTATKPFRKITETIKKLDQAIELLILKEGLS